MQSRYSGGGRPKKFKYTLREISGRSSTVSGSCSDELEVTARKESISKATEYPINDTVTGDVVRDIVDKFSNSNSDTAANAPSEVIQEPANKDASAAPSTNSSLFDKPPNNSPIAESTMGTTAMSAEDHSNNTTALHCAGGVTPASDPGADCIETATSSLPPNELINTKRPILDEPGNSLETVLEALKTQNTDRIADSAVPGKCTMLTSTEPMDFPKIISGIGINCVDNNLMILASALEIEKEQLQEHERNRLSQIKQDREQMNLWFAERTEKEEKYQGEEMRLPKDTEKAIACLNIRELANRILKEILSEPTELIGEFTEDDEFENLIKEIDKENASSAKKLGRAVIKETYYWPILVTAPTHATPRLMILTRSYDSPLPSSRPQY